MANLTQFPKPKRSDRKVTIWKSGDMTIGRSQPVRSDKGDHPLAGIHSTKDFFGAKIKEADKDNSGFYLTEAGISIKPITRVSILDRQSQKETTPETLEKIAIAYQAAGDHEMADRFGYAYAMKLASGDYTVNVDPNLASPDDDWCDESDSSMGLSDVTNSHKSPSTKKKYIKNSGQRSQISQKRRGSNGITPIAKRQIRSGVTIMQEKYSIYCMAFGTCTLPALRPEELELVNTHWSDIVRKFLQELTRELARCGLDTDYVYVTEIQEKRYKVWGQLCPHLHFVIQSRKDRFSDPAIHYSLIKRFWAKQLSNLLGRKVECPAATQLEKMKRRKVGEMGKYMTKGSQIAKEAIAKGDGHMLPTAWSGMSNNMKKEVKSSIKILTGQEAEDFIENLEILQDAGLLSYKPIFWTPPDIDRQVTIGFVGWVRNVNQTFKFLSGCYEHFSSHIGVICQFKSA